MWNIWLIIGIDLCVLIIVTAIVSYYLRISDNADVASVFYAVFILISQVTAVKVAAYDLSNVFVQGLVYLAPSAVIFFPYTFQMTDMVNEKLGRKATHKMIFIAFLTQVLMVILFMLSVNMPYAEGPWDATMQQYWESFFGIVPRITLASWIAFLISENADAIFYQFFKNLTGGKHLWIRNVFSDLLSLSIDTLIFIPLAFWGVFPFEVILSLILGQFILKWFVGLIDTPLMYFTRWIFYTPKLDGFDSRIKNSKFFSYFVH